MLKKYNSSITSATWKYSGEYSLPNQTKLIKEDQTFALLDHDISSKKFVFGGENNAKKIREKFKMQDSLNQILINKTLDRSIIE